jgi:hypothetical protein
MNADIRAEVMAERKADRFFSIFEERENYEALNKLSIEDLRRFNAMVIEVLKQKKDKVANTKKRELKVGDIVQTTGNKTEGMIFEIIKLNPKYILAKNEKGAMWNLTYSSVIIPE